MWMAGRPILAGLEYLLPRLDGKRIPEPQPPCWRPSEWNTEKLIVAPSSRGHLPALERTATSEKCLGRLDLCLGVGGLCCLLCVNYSGN